MKIAIDYTLAKSHIGGMGVFVRNIVKKLQKNDKGNKYLLTENPIDFDKKNLSTKIISVIKQHLWYQIRFPQILNKINANILYSPNPPSPFFYKKPIILTIPDMAFVYEDSISKISKVYILINYFLAAKKAKHITTFSKFSKRDIQKILRVKPEKISIIPLAASNKFNTKKNKVSIKNTLQKYKITKKFILCTPGSFLPRKNAKDLLIAYSNLKNCIRKKLCVVLVGNTENKHYKILNKFIKELGIPDSVIFTGYIKSETVDILNLYKEAFIFAYPSLYEGFGMPPLEAMQCGIPVIVYNKTSLPEVVGNSGLIVNDSKELKNAIENLFTNKNLYKTFAKRGLRKAKEFNWKSSAKSFEKIISSLEV